MATKTDQDFVNEIKELIFKTSLEVTKNVNKAAIEHVLKQMPETDMAQPMCKDLFLNKVPDAVAKKVTKRLNNVLGLNLDLPSKAM